MRTALLISHSILAIVIGFFSGYTIQRKLNKQITDSATANITQLSRDLTSRLDYGLHRRLEYAENFGNLVGITDEKYLHQMLQNNQSRVTNTSWIGFIDKSGKVISESNSLYAGNNVSDSAWFQAALHSDYMKMAEDSDLIQDLLGHDSQMKYFIVAVPVKDAKLNTIGVLAFYVEIKWAEEVKLRLQNTIDPDIGTKIVLLDNDNNIVSNTDAVSDNAFRLTKVPVTKSGVYEDNLDDQTYLIGYSRMQVEGLNWMVLAYVKKDLAFAPLEEAKADLVKYSAFFALVAFACSLTLAQFLSRPIRRLDKAVKRLKEEGEFLPDFRSYQEIESLRDSFNDLLEQIRSGKINNEYFKESFYKNLQAQELERQKGIEKET